MTAPAGCQLIGRWRITEADIWDRGMGVPEIRRLEQLEKENSKLKRVVADLALDRAMLQGVLRRKW